jgi:nicotinamide-nucleotide amidase
MPITLVYIDQTIYIDSASREMLIRKLKAKNLSIKSIHYLEHNDIKLIDRLQTIFNESTDILIAASPEAYPLISRILATLCEETLIATKNTLHPANAIKVSDNSFLLNLNRTICNVILLKGSEDLPQILLDSGQTFTTWQLFGTKEDLNSLKQYALDKQYYIGHRQIIQGWYELTTHGTYRAINLLIFSDDLLCFPSQDIFATTIEAIQKRGERITFAESCTGGLIASSFTARSGSSAILKGSVVSYADLIKNLWLDVDKEILEKYGAVSQECVTQMAEGALSLADSDIALATSGIAGPTGGTPTKPVGSVHIAVATNAGTTTEYLLLEGDRNYIQYQAMMHTVKLMVLCKKNIFEEFFKNA